MTPDSQQRRALLQAGLWTATGTTHRVSSQEPFDRADPSSRFDGLIAQALEQKMVPMLVAFGRDRSLQLPREAKRLTEVFRVFSGVLYRELEAIVSCLSEAGIPTMLLKGGDLDLNVYPERLPRAMNDLDLMVHPADVAATERTFHDAGYRQGWVDRDNLRIRSIDLEQKARLEANEAELLDWLKLVRLEELDEFGDEISKTLHWPDFPFLLDGEDAYGIVSFDVHVNLSTGFDVEDCWRSPRRFSVAEGSEILGQSYSDLLWFLAARLYHETMLHSRPAMRYFVDVVALVHRFGGEIDWERIAIIAERYKLCPSMYFVLWHVRELLGNVVPGDVLREVDLLRPGVSRNHDWGDFVPKMMGEVAIHPLAFPVSPMGSEHAFGAASVTESSTRGR